MNVLKGFYLLVITLLYLLYAFCMLEGNYRANKTLMSIGIFVTVLYVMCFCLMLLD